MMAGDVYLHGAFFGGSDQLGPWALLREGRA